MSALNDNKSTNIYMSLYCSAIVSAICLSFILPLIYWVSLALGAVSAIIYIKRKIKYLTFLFTSFAISSVLLVSITQRLFLDGTNYLDSNKVGFILSLMTGYFLAQNFSSASKTRYIPIIVVCLVYFTSFIIGIKPSDIHPMNSENFVFVPVLISLIYLLSFSEVPNIYVRLVLATLILAISIISGSRSAMLLALVLGITLISSPKLQPVTIIVSIVFIIVTTYLVYTSEAYEVFYIFEFAEKFEKRGLTSFSRLIMWEGYAEKIYQNIHYFVNGIDLESIPELHRYGLNPHNSFLGMHSSVGALVTFVFIVTILFAIYGAYPANHYMYVAITCLFVRAFVDINIIYGRSDFVLFFIIFLYVDNRSSSSHSRSF